MTAPQPPRRSIPSILRALLCRVLCGQQQAQPPATFVPGHVHILSEYPTALQLSKPQVVERIQRKLRQVAQVDSASAELISGLKLMPEQVVILPGPSLTLAAIFGDAPNMRANPAGLLRSINKLNTTIHKPPLGRPSDGGGTEKGGGDESGGGVEYDQTSQTAPTSPTQVPSSETSGTARAQLRTRTVRPAPATPRGITADPDGFDLRAAAPNWLSNGAPYGVGGGPGAVPLEELNAPSPWQFGNRPDLAAPDPIPTPPPVEIAILDSVPSLEDLENAYKTWIGAGVLDPPTPPTPLNDLLYQLLSNATTGQFDISSTGQVEVIYPSPDVIPPIATNGHEYAMSSHGLFIAGIIRSLAPQAKVRLIRILNNNCGGTVESIHKGLEVLAQLPRSTPLIVNCSFVLRTPRPGPNEPPAAPENPLTPAEIDSLTQALQDALTLVAGTNTLIVAAAGNEGRGAGAPRARFPAAFSEVIGVGALDDDDPNTPPQLASYSDEPDDPPGGGFVTFGGAADLQGGGENSGNAPPPITSATDGIISAFIDPWPEQTGGPYNTKTNTSGLARWAGTSFATPIIVAALANRISKGDTPSQAITQLSNGAPLLAGGAAVIEATQG